MEAPRDKLRKSLAKTSDTLEKLNNFRKSGIGGRLDRNPLVTVRLSDRGDLHTRIASRLLKKPYSEVTPDERAMAKREFHLLTYASEPTALEILFGSDILADDWEDTYG